MKRFASFIMRTAKQWNSLPKSVFPERYNQDILQAKVNRNLLGKRTILGIIFVFCQVTLRSNVSLFYINKINIILSMVRLSVCCLGIELYEADGFVALYKFIISLFGAEIPQMVPNQEFACVNNFAGLLLQPFWSYYIDNKINTSKPTRVTAKKKKQKRFTLITVISRYTKY